MTDKTILVWKGYFTKNALRILRISLIELPAFFDVIGQGLFTSWFDNRGHVYAVSGYIALQIGEYDSKARSVAGSVRHGNLSVVLFNNTLCYC